MHSINPTINKFCKIQKALFTYFRLHGVRRIVVGAAAASLLDLWKGKMLLYALLLHRSLPLPAAAFSPAFITAMSRNRKGFKF
jgi:hypothetical protein